jgi:tetratricopeptide (TPR) repeat protein
VQSEEELKNEGVQEVLPEIRINGEEQKAESNESVPAPQVILSNPDDQDRLSNLPMERSIVDSPFKETKLKVKYHLKCSKFNEAVAITKAYIDEHNLEDFNIEERSKVILRYVLTLIKAFRLSELGTASECYILPQIEQARAESNVTALARLLYAQQRIVALLAFKDQMSILGQIKSLLEEHPDSLEVAKYFVKIHLSVPKDGFIIDAKEAFNFVRAAERVNEESLVKRHRYSKMTTKINLIKIKSFDVFYNQGKFHQLTSSVLSTVGLKGTNAPNVMSVLADQNSKKGDHEKAQQYIARALTLANEVLDGIKTHKKYVGILDVKSQILQRRKKFQEALAAVSDMESMITEVYGGDNLFLKSSIHLRKAQIYTEIKGDEYKAEDHLKDYGRLSEQIYGELAAAKEQSCLNYTYQV